jgi:hypothetical protein
LDILDSPADFGNHMDHMDNMGDVDDVDKKILFLRLGPPTISKI